jgi:MoxR-like ATPase
MTVTNPQIQAKLDAAATAKAAQTSKGRTGPAADVRDYLDALVQLGRAFNGNGVSVKPDGRVFLFGALSTAAQVQTSVTNLSAWDDAEVSALLAALDAALTA